MGEINHIVTWKQAGNRRKTFMYGYAARTFARRMAKREGVSDVMLASYGDKPVAVMDDVVS